MLSIVVMFTKATKLCCFRYRSPPTVLKLSDTTSTNNHEESVSVTEIKKKTLWELQLMLR